MKIAKIRLLAVSVLILLSISQTNGQYSQSSSPGAVAASRVVPLTIKVVLLGFSSTDLNSSYLTSGIDSIPVKYQQVLQGPINTGVMYNFTYQYVYEAASSALVQSFARYVNSTGIKQDTVPGTPVPFFGNPALNNTGTKVSLVHNYFYDANKVENWLISNQTLFSLQTSTEQSYPRCHTSSTKSPLPNVLATLLWLFKPIITIEQSLIRISV